MKTKHIVYWFAFICAVGGGLVFAAQPPLPFPFNTLQQPPQTPSPTSPDMLATPPTSQFPFLPISPSGINLPDIDTVDLGAVPARVPSFFRRLFTFGDTAKTNLIFEELAVRANAIKQYALTLKNKPLMSSDEAAKLGGLFDEYRASAEKLKPYFPSVSLPPASRKSPTPSVPLGFDALKQNAQQYGESSKLMEERWKKFNDPKDPLGQRAKNLSALDQRHQNLSSAVEKIIDANLDTAAQRRVDDTYLWELFVKLVEARRVLSRFSAIAIFGIEPPLPEPVTVQGLKNSRRMMEQGMQMFLKAAEGVKKMVAGGGVKTEIGDVQVDLRYTKGWSGADMNSDAPLEFEIWVNPYKGDLDSAELNFEVTENGKLVKDESWTMPLRAVKQHIGIKKTASLKRIFGHKYHVAVSVVKNGKVLGAVSTDVTIGLGTTQTSDEPQRLP